MSLSSLSLLFTIANFAVLLARASRDECMETPSCGQAEDYMIRFPFRLRDEQSINCGYPGFDLYCTQNSETVLDLPNIPFKVYLNSIDYYEQEIRVHIPGYHNSTKARYGTDFLNLSSTAFQSHYSFSRATLLSCPTQYLTSCIKSAPRSYQCSVLGTSRVQDYLRLINCTKMYDYSAQIDQFQDEISPVDYFILTWTKPSCKECEEQGKECRLRTNSVEHETECFDGGSLRSILTAGSIACSFVVLVIFIAICVHLSEKNDEENRLGIEKFLEDYMALKPSRYSYADVKKITNQFKEKLGQGAYGTVFKGKLSNDVYVAVKILNSSKGNGEEFINEVATMGRIHHVNVVRLVGFCADGVRRALVYEFLPNDSLDKYTSSQASTINRSLSWEKLQEIALGIARGIEYLHQGCDQRILHFDIKPHNILLDQNFSPKIADFGLAKLCSKDQSIVSMTTARGTMGYIAPEVFSRNFGNVSYKSDVYSFGMLVLEMVGGRKNTIMEEEENDEIYYPEWIYNLLEEGEDLRIQIEEEGDAKIAKKLAIVGLWCIQWHPVGRPTMKVVVRMLEGGEELTMPPNPFASSGSSNITTKMPARRIPLELEAIAE